MGTGLSNTIIVLRYTNNNIWRLSWILAALWLRLSLSIVLRVSPAQLLATNGHVLDLLLRTFKISHNSLFSVAGLLEYREYMFDIHYAQVRESPERLDQLLRFAHEKALHGTIYSVAKLKRNLELATALLDKDGIRYEPNILSHADQNFYCGNLPKDTVFLLARHAATYQMHRMEDIKPFIEMISSLKLMALGGFLELILPVMFPELLSHLLKMTLRNGSTHFDVFKGSLCKLATSTELHHTALLIMAAKPVASQFRASTLLAGLLDLARKKHNISEDCQLNDPSWCEQLITSLCSHPSRESSHRHTLAHLILHYSGLPQARVEFFATAALNIIDLNLPPFYSRPLVHRLLSMSIDCQHILSRLGEEQLPLQLISPDVMRREWLRMRPFCITKAPPRLISLDMPIYEGVWEALHSDCCTTFPVNCMFNRPFVSEHGKSSYNLIDATIDVAEGILERGDMFIQQQQQQVNTGEAAPSFKRYYCLFIIISSWRALLLRQRQLDFSPLFPIIDVDWEGFIKRMSNYVTGDPAMEGHFQRLIRDRLHVWHISDHFTLTGIRELIDSSYSGG